VPCKLATDSLKADVFVFQEGIQIDVNTVKALTQVGPLRDFGLPSSMLNSTDALTVMIPGATAPQYDTSGSALRKVYTTLVSTGSDNFTKRFRFYEKTFIQSAAEERKEKKVSTAYKCIPVDTRKNLKKVGDKFVVSLDDDDLTQANSLQDIMDQQNAAAQVDQADISDAASYVALAIGATIGAALASGALWLGFRYLVRK
jgi:hypothetical protein